MRNLFLRLFVGSILICTALLIPASCTQKSSAAEPKNESEDPGWPREVKTGNLTFTIYQPQLDSWDGNKLNARAAVSVKTSEKEEPVYGVLWISGLTDVNKGDRIVTLQNIKVDKVDFPSAPEKTQEYVQKINQEVIKKTKVISLDRLEAELAIMQAEQVGNVPVKNDPPRIIFASVPSMLVYIDGEPVYRPAKDTQLQRVMNTRPLLLQDALGQQYLHVFDGWMQSAALSGPWVVAMKISKDLTTAEKQAVDSGQVDLLTGEEENEEGKTEKPSLKKGPVPRIYVATTATELIVTDGEPKYVPIGGTQLLYVENTTGNIFKYLSDQKTYVLLSGRWFRSATTNGPWEFVAGEGLPPDFAKIPDDSAKENVKASVPGTAQAKEALIANSIPQTAEVKKKDAKLETPAYDGEPQWSPIESTSLQYVVNTPTPVIMVSPTSYYAVQNGVWFTSASLRGTWVVASSVPAVIYSIPPSSPLYYVTSVRVYNSTPEVVYVGYTPGYYGTVVSNRVVVYGTGYYYRPWIGSYWYGPPVTYGFGTAVTYTPWTGWAYGFGFGWSWGYSTVGWGWGARPWWGSYYPYRGAAWGPHGAAVWGPGGWAATSGNIYSRWGSTSVVSRSSGGYNAWTGNRWASQVGMSYNSTTGRISAGQRAAVGNVYTGDYAYGKRGVTGTPGGVKAGGSKVTVGNANSGKEATAGRGTVYNPNTGNATKVGGVKGDQGGAIRVGDNVYAGKDGDIYKRGDDGWQQMEKNGQWKGMQDNAKISTLDRQQTARVNVQQRTQNYSSGGYRAASAPIARRR